MFDAKEVVNLSSKELTEDELSILSKGLKFCPTPDSTDAGLIREDLDKLHKRLRQIAFYEDIENNSTLDSSRPVVATQPLDTDPNNLLSHKPFKHRKFKLPAKGRGPPGPLNLEAMILSNERDLNSRDFSHPPLKRNLTPGERKALDSLANDQNIVIRGADKGASIVVQDRADYLREGYKQLSDKKFYRELEVDPTEEFRKEIQFVVEDLYQSGEIDDTVKSFLTDTSCKASRFYLLPKIHKGINPPPGRPVVASNGSPTEKISKFVDHFLNPTTQKIKSFVKDTTHFLSLINDLGEIPEDAILATLDVTSLYTNIPNREGVMAADEALNRSRRGPDLKPSNNSLIKLLKLVLGRNNFKFNGRHFLQIKGTAIGTKLAPGFANNYMAWFERLFVYLFHNQSLIWLRFIDDIFLVWTHGEEALHDFVTFLNSRVETMNFTLEFSTASVNFLDTKVKKVGTRLYTDLYCKPTDSHSYLQYSSAHPQRCKDSIPFSQFLRVRRICSLTTDFEQHILTFMMHFLRRGYPMPLLEKAAQMARDLDRLKLLNPESVDDEDDKGTVEEQKVFLITTFHPTDHSLRKIVFNNWDYLGKSPTTSGLHDRKLMVGYRRPKNLKEFLVRANIPLKEGDDLCRPTGFDYPFRTEKEETTVQETGQVASTSGLPITRLVQKSIKDFFPSNTGRRQVVAPLVTLGPQGGTPGGSNPSGSAAENRSRAGKRRGFNFCNTRGCRYCPKLNKTGSITSPVTHRRYSCMKNISCRSSNLVYCIMCKRCNKQYVGQTYLRLKDRFVHHYYSIDKQDQSKPVGKHFSQRSHAGIDDVEIYILEFIKKPPTSEVGGHARDRVEKRWIHLLRSPAPLGLNLDD
jgi:hypothetical protein